MPTSVIDSKFAGFVRAFNDEEVVKQLKSEGFQCVRRNLVCILSTNFVFYETNELINSCSRGFKLVNCINDGKRPPLSAVPVLLPRLHRRLVELQPSNC